MAGLQSIQAAFAPTRSSGTSARRVKMIVAPPEKYSSASSTAAAASWRSTLAAAAAAATLLVSSGAATAAPDIDAVRAAVRADFVDRQYYITGDLTRGLYADDCVFVDPTTTVTGSFAVLCVCDLIAVLAACSLPNITTHSLLKTSHKKRPRQVRARRRAAVRPRDEPRRPHRARQSRRRAFSAALAPRGPAARGGLGDQAIHGHDDVHDCGWRGRRD